MFHAVVLKKGRVRVVHSVNSGRDSVRIYSRPVNVLATPKMEAGGIKRFDNGRIAEQPARPRPKLTKGTSPGDETSPLRPPREGTRPTAPLTVTGHSSAPITLPKGEPRIARQFTAGNEFQLMESRRDG